jgi:separase
LEAVKAFPFSLTGESGIDFNASTGLKQLGSIVDRLTYLGTCELFLEPQEVSLMRPLTDRPDTLVGSLLERQLESLQSSLWKEGVREVVKILLSDALEVYGRQPMPVRKAKVMVRCMEFMYHGGIEGQAAMGWDIDEMGKEIGGLERSHVGTLNLTHSFQLIMQSLSSER